jgi:hypothetical protein
MRYRLSNVHTKDPDKRYLQNLLKNRGTLHCGACNSICIRDVIQLRIEDWAENTLAQLDTDQTGIQHDIVDSEVPWFMAKFRPIGKTSLDNYNRKLVKDFKLSSDQIAAVLSYTSRSKTYMTDLERKMFRANVAEGDIVQVTFLYDLQDLSNTWAVEMAMAMGPIEIYDVH